MSVVIDQVSCAMPSGDKMDPLDSSLKREEELGLHATIDVAIMTPEATNDATSHYAKDSKITPTEDETDGVLLGPAILWGILISECRAGSAYGQSNELEQGPSFQEPGQTPFNDAVGSPAILWGILLSGMSPKAMTDSFPRSEVLDESVIKLWIIAGYDPLPEDSANSAITEELVEEFTQSTPSGPFIVKESPGRGQGMFTARNVGKGERILVEKPFFVVPKEYNQRTVLDGFNHMSLAKRKQYMQLTCPDRWDDVHMTDVMRIFEANCFNIGDSAAMFLTATRFNHSCVPNTYYSWSADRSEMIFHAMIDMFENEEMTICYGNPFRTLLQRRYELRIYNFRCRCPACQETPFGQASESRRLTMRALDEQIIMFQSMLNEALLLYGLRDPLTAILRLIKLIKEEGLHGELMTPYRDAADYLKGRGNFEEALDFAHLELDEEVVCLGNDSEVVHKTIEYIEELEKELDKGDEVQDYADAELMDPDADIDPQRSMIKAPRPDTRKERINQSDDMPLEKQPDLDTKSLDVAINLNKETVDDVEDSSAYATYSDDVPMDSRSSSPRLVRKK
ncbi:MAG: hypothetical protein ASARMPRED_005923 [Alectoria sarmentosa]|nr:MAG: hypothetical protein ASARMPRED_005923 [Alectoria sarmentosa]